MFLKLLLLAAAVIGADAHAYMSNPAPRARTTPGHRFQTEPQSDGAMWGECADNGAVGPVQATWVQGQEVEVEITITANHKGWHLLRFCQDPKGTNACLEKNLAVAKNPSRDMGCPAAAPEGSTEKPCIQSPAENREDLPSGNGVYKSRFILPANFTGLPEHDYHVKLQWWWPTSNWGGEHFKSCHDVRVLPAGAAPEPELPEEEPEPEPEPPQDPEQPELPAYCQGEPCDAPNCRSSFGWCGPPQTHCDSNSVWRPECLEL